MSKSETVKKSLEVLLLPARISLVTSVWLGEAAFSGVNKVVPLKKLGRDVLHFVDKNRLVNYREKNAVRQEKDSIVKEMGDRPRDNKLVDSLALSYAHVSLREAGKRAVKAVNNLDLEIHIAETAQVMEDSGVLPKTIEIAIGRVRERMPNSTAPDMVDGRLTDHSEQPKTITFA